MLLSETLCLNHNRPKKPLVGAKFYRNLDPNLILHISKTELAVGEKLKTGPMQVFELSEFAKVHDCYCYVSHVGDVVAVDTDRSSLLTTFGLISGI